jgi:glutathione S-transferase
MSIQQTACCANLDRMSPGKTQRTHRLFAIAVSHYSEKARWALSYYRVPYQQQLLLPWLHVFSVKTIVDAQVCVRQSRDTRSSPYSTPCLAIYDDSGSTLKESLHDSHDVLVYLSENFATVDSVNLYTSCGQTKEEEIRALEKHYDETLGVAACNFFYLDMLRFARWRSILPFATMGFKNKVGLLQSLIWFALSPILGRLIISAMRMGSSHHDAMQTCREIFHHASECEACGLLSP